MCTSIPTVSVGFFSVWQFQSLISSVLMSQYQITTKGRVVLQHSSASLRMLNTLNLNQCHYRFNENTVRITVFSCCQPGRGSYSLPGNGATGFYQALSKVLIINGELKSYIYTRIGSSSKPPQNARVCTTNPTCRLVSCVITWLTVLCHFKLQLTR